MGDSVPIREQIDSTACETTIQAKEYPDLHNDSEHVSEYFEGQGPENSQELERGKGRELEARAIEYQSQNNHRDVAQNFSDAAHYYEKSGDHDKAVILYEMAISEYDAGAVEHHLAERHDLAAVLFFSAAGCYKKLNNSVKAQEMYEKAASELEEGAMKYQAKGLYEQVIANLMNAIICYGESNNPTKIQEIYDKLDSHYHSEWTHFYKRYLQ